MKKGRTIKIVILAVIVIAAIIVFICFMNRGSNGTTADMSLASLPTISFETAGREANMLVGHKREMNMVSMRDTIIVLDKENKVVANIKHADGEISSLKYEVYSLDGTELLMEKTVKNPEKEITLNCKGILKDDQEGVLKITLQHKGKPLYYYTRIVEEQDYKVKECIKYISELHSDLLNKKNEEGIKKVMEPNAQGNNKTLAHVTIHSNLTQVTWGNLKPEIVGDVHYEIKEANEAYTAVQLHYLVNCAGDNNEEELYRVKEFFKVSYGKERCYLLEYDRKMQEEFDTSNVVLSSKGVILGISDGELQHKVNEKGTVVAFVHAQELWVYNKEEDTFSLVFSFSDAKKEDVRNRTDQHSIEILSLDENGNMTFSVCGYMNRGTHEGESGVAIYYYQMKQNVIKEEAFIPSTESKAIIKKDLAELAYYNAEQDAVYVMANGTLQKEEKILMTGLQKGQYVASQDGHLLAYQTEKDEKSIVEIWDFSKDSKKEISGKAGEIIIPLGFVGNDLVYGVALSENAGQDEAGKQVQAMHRLEIRDEKLKVVKTYQKEDAYILGVSIKNNMITLRQGTKNGNQYKEIAEDYITNNDKSASDFVELQSYWTDLKETQYRLNFTKGIQDKNAKTLRPKQELQEKEMVIKLEKKEAKGYFYVYGLGEQAGVFEEPGEAISLASELSGVVISPKQNYLWEDGNREAWYRNFKIERFTPKEGENTLAACVRRVLTYEGKPMDAMTELSTKTPEQVLGEQLNAEVVRFHNCSSKDMFYLIDKGNPVIALKNGTSAILLIGYDAKTVTYVEPSSGSIFTSAIEKVDEMVSGSSRTFIGYVR